MSASELETRSGRAPLGRTLVLDQFTPYRIVSLGHMLSGKLARAYADENITIPEWRVLAVVAQAQSLAARDVVRLTPMDKMSVSRAIASLEQKKFAKRSVSTSDRRVNMIALTPEGRALFDKIAALALTVEDELLGELSAAERKTFIATLEKLEAAADDMRGVVVE